MTDTNEPRATPAFTTGGGGFEFEDRVGTWVLAAMLAGQAPIGDLGVPSRIEFQQKSPATELDDIVVTAGTGASSPRWLASIKSYDMLRGEPLAEFVAAAWAVYLSPGFDQARDFLGLVAGVAHDDDWRSLSKLIDIARIDTPARLAESIAIPGAFNETDRRVWKSFRCPEALAKSAKLDIGASPAFLLRRLNPLHLDFRSADSHAQAQAKHWCGEALAVGHVSDAGDLFNAAYELVSRTRSSGGSIDWSHVHRALGGRFTLALRPDARPDWSLLQRHTGERVNAVNDTLAGGLTLPRSEARRELAPHAQAPFVYLTGPSGCGKTALAKAWLVEGTGSQLWLAAHDLASGLLDLGRRLGLRLAVDDVLALGQRPVRVVVDGLDRIYDSEAHASVAALARIAAESGGHIQVLVTSQTFSLDRTAALVGQAGAPTHETVLIGDLDDDDVAIALRERPELQRLLLQGELRQILRRPKMLQVVLRTLEGASDERLDRGRTRARRDPCRR